MTTRTASPGSSLRVGFSKQDITPPLPFPMGGMASRKDRLADRIRDPLCASALAIGNGKKTVAVVSADLLMITALLRESVQTILEAANIKLDGLMLAATHSHSAPGGFWNANSAALFMGRYRQDLFDHLAQGIAQAVKAAVKDLQPAELFFGDTQTDYLNYNRRHKDGPVDRTLGVFTARRKKGKDIKLVTFGAHPVVAAFRQYNTASADYPGEVVRSIEADGELGMFLVGPVGGVNVLFPEGPMDLDVHLSLLARLIREQIDAAVANQKPVDGDVIGYAHRETTIHITVPRLFPDAKPVWDVLLYPLRLWVQRFGRGGGRDGKETRVSAIRVGDLVFTGFPADLGAGLGLAARNRIEKAGLRTVVVASQTDDYVGYVHMPPEDQQFESQDKGAMWMTIYENALGFGGRDTGTRLLALFEQALQDVRSI